MQYYDGGGGAPKQKSGSGFMGFIDKIAPFVPIVGGIAQNIIGGINERKARLYNSPANQVKRLNEAGLPKAAASNISPGGGVVATSSLGTEQLNQNLSSSITRQIDRKKLDIMNDEARLKQYEADLAEGNVKNKLNPAGVFEPTNQGISAMQEIQTQAEAVKAAQIVNKWMPVEKFNNVMKTGYEINKIAADTRNSLSQNEIIVAEGKIKNIVASYQARMSLQELMNITERNTGIRQENELKRIAISIEYQTMFAQIMSAQNAAMISGQSLEAAQLSNVLTKLSMPSTEAYYTVRRFVDNIHTNKPNLIKSMIYLGMFQPNTSNYQIGNLIPSMPNISGGKTFNTHNYINPSK